MEFEHSGRELEKISPPLLAVNSADDLINPPELAILGYEIGRVAHGRAILIPYSEHTRGHGSHNIAALWKPYLKQLPHSPERRGWPPGGPHHSRDTKCGASSAMPLQPSSPSVRSISEVRMVSARATPGCPPAISP
jgi:hypothetical protein